MYIHKILVYSGQTINYPLGMAMEFKSNYN